MREDICVDNFSILFPGFVTQKIAKLFDGDFLGTQWRRLENGVVWPQPIFMKAWNLFERWGRLKRTHHINILYSILKVTYLYIKWYVMQSI